MNGTDRHVRPIFTIQINTCQDRTKPVVETATNKFQVRCLQALSALSVAAKRDLFGLAAFVRHCARPKRWDNRWFGASKPESYNDINGVGRMPPQPASPIQAETSAQAPRMVEPATDQACAIEAMSVRSNAGAAASPDSHRFASYLEFPTRTTRDFSRTGCQNTDMQLPAGMAA